MKTQFEILIKSRELVIKLIDDLTIEQLHVIPKGFKNNIAWNVAHLVVTQQLLHYKLSGVNCLVPDDLIASFRKGTFPEREFNNEEFDEVKELLIALPETLIEDYEAGIFEDYEVYETSTGFVLDSLETAIAFNNFHEGMHLGVIRSIKKLV
ncbi:DinB family protein [Polaribacter uvawellassae]|uniref:DinB family protein n=1 Tax=Polaribacter uvawellassae TaxID=3133495 RepID=UPI00321BE16E